MRHLGDRAADVLGGICGGLGVGARIGARELLLAQCHAEAGAVGQVDKAILGQRLVGEQAAKVRDDLVGFG